MTEYVVVFITAAGEEEAARIAREVVEARLAACVTIVKGIRSIYRWKGAIEDEAEVLMVLKTRRLLFDALAARVRELHSYSVPEIIAIPVAEGSRDYLTWLGNETAP